MEATKTGFFVVLEGIDGSGTTTQLLALEQSLRSRGVNVVATREPTPGPVGQLLRSALERRLTDAAGTSLSLDWTTLALLFAADRRDHLVREVEPALAGGAIVISDRYYLSSLLYQSATSPEGDAALPWLQALNSRARRPDLTLVLTIDADVAEARRKKRGGGALRGHPAPKTPSGRVLAGERIPSRRGGRTRGSRAIGRHHHRPPPR